MSTWSPWPEPVDPTRFGLDTFGLDTPRPHERLPRWMLRTDQHRVAEPARAETVRHLSIALPPSVVDDTLLLQAMAIVVDAEVELGLSTAPRTLSAWLRLNPCAINDHAYVDWHEPSTNRRWRSCRNCGHREP